MRYCSGWMWIRMWLGMWLFFCKALSKLILNSQQRPYTDQFKVTLTAGATTRNFDYRDLVVSKQFENSFLFCAKNVGNDIPSGLDLLIKMNELYEDVQKELPSSPSDSYETYAKQMEEELKKSEFFNTFKDKNVPEEIDDLFLSFPLDIIFDVLQLASGWCDGLDISFAEERASELLRAFDYIDINCEKEVDLFFDNRGAPLHLRIRAINLFCINFVYLLKKNALLARYKALLKCAYNRPKDNERKLLYALKGSKKPLLNYIQLLEIKTEGDSVTNLFIGSDSFYFAFKLLYESNSKVIFLQSEYDLKRWVKPVSPRLDLIVELNTINKPITIRLDIQMPFFYISEGVLRNLIDMNPSEYLYKYNHYVALIGIHKEITEVYIEYLSPLIKKVQYSLENVNEVDDLLIDMVLAVFEELDNLRSLLIRGFITLPERLVELVRNKKLEKFGAMSWNGQIDYYAIYQIFKTECPLSQSIRHFIGHYRALEFLIRLIESNELKTQIREATISDIIAGHRASLVNIVRNEASLAYYERIYGNAVKEYFVGDSTKNELKHSSPIYLETFYYMQPSILTHILNARDEIVGDGALGRQAITISAREIYRKCKINRLVMHEVGKAKQFICDINKIATNGAIKINTIEVIHSMRFYCNNMTYLEGYKNTGDACLVLNLEDFEDNDLCSLFNQFVIEPNNGSRLKVRYRVKCSDERSVEKLKSIFINHYKELYKIEVPLDFAGIEFIDVPYNVGDDALLQKIHF
ncbi:hypothetical protein ENBRE01_1313 [Enteropsectra breve]|nr:hypothetical protein ENBRE01_1313 [Enteropsectra breve]